MNIDLSKTNLTFRELWEVKSRVLAMRDGISHKRNLRLFELKDLDIDTITEKFSFKVMQAEHKEFCPMLARDTACHDMQVEELSCYGCICPNYDLEIGFDEERNLYKLGFCKVNSEHGFYKLTQTKDEHLKDYLIWNCINCNIPHNKTFIQKEIAKDIKRYERK